MNNMFIILFTTFVVLNAQTAGQIKEQLKNSNSATDQAKQMAKDDGIEFKLSLSSRWDKGTDLPVWHLKPRDEFCANN